MSTTLKELFVGNPMFAEIQREKKRALAEHNWRGGQLAVRILIAVFYLFLLILTLSFIQVVEPIIVMYIMLGLATIVLPANLHGTIAGEREQRALDMLLVAPVTPGQIIIGKFAKVSLTVGMLVLFIGVPALLIELVKQTDTSYRYGMQTGGFSGFLVSLVLIIAASLMIGALTMWISSKTKTKTGAMLATIGALFVLFIVLPALGGVMSFVSPAVSEFFVNTNPYVALYWAYTGMPEETNYGYNYSSVFHVHPATYVWPTIFAMVILAVLFLTLATTNLQRIALGRTD